MLSKILIDVDNQGSATINIKLPKNSYYPATDNTPELEVRDKLVRRFLDGGMFCLITRTNEHNDAEIHSMNALDVLANIRDIYGQMFKDSDSYRDFEQAIFKVASLLEDATGERSLAFDKKAGKIGLEDIKSIIGSSYEDRAGESMPKK